MKKAELIKDPPVKVKRKKGVVYTGRRFNAAGSRVIETDIYQDGKLIVRHFTYKDGWQNYEVESGIWNTNSLQWIMQGGKPYWYGGGTLYPSHEEASYKKLSDDSFIHNTSSMVERMEMEVRWEKQKRAHERKQERIDDEMDALTPELPKDFEKFVNKKIIGQRQALCKDKVLYCAKCGELISEKGSTKTGDTVKCTHCRRKLIVNARKESIQLTKGIQMYQQDNSGGSIERQFVVKYEACPGYKENVQITEVCRGFADYPGGIWHKWRYGKHKGYYGKYQQFWESKGESCINNLRKKNILYDGNLDEIELTEHALSTIKALKEYGEEFEWSYIIRRCCDDYTFEAVAKSGIRGLAIQKAKGNDPRLMLEGGGTRLHEMLGITRQQLHILREIDGTYISVQAMQEHRNIKKEELILLEKYGKTFQARENLKKMIKKDIPLTHVCTLLAKTAKVTPEVLSMYCDYLDMAAYRGMDIHDEIVYRSKKWKTYHDRYLADKEARKNKKKDIKFKEIRTDYKRNTEIFGYEAAGYVFLVPRKATDLVIEGQHQHNCVGSSESYMKKMAEHKSFIIFLRKKENPEESFYTIEIELTGKVLQAYSAYNRKTEWDDVKPVIDKWKTEVRKRMKKLGVTA